MSARESPHEDETSGRAGERRPGDVDDPMIGTVVSDRYRIVGAIARGGMSTVYRAEHTTLARVFAVKCLSRDLVSDVDAGRRFEREARLASTLRHPNVVEVVDFGRMNDGRPYLVMELCTGTDLRTLIKEGGPPPLARLREIVRQVCLALDHAHKAGIVHRDLKSANIMIEGGLTGDHVKMIDFGISKGGEHSEHLTATGVTLGTPEFMSPEQVSGVEVDARSDVYSLACVLYEALAGRVPFTGPTAAVLTAHLLTPPTKLRTHAPSLTAEVERVVMRGLEKEPAQRWQSVQELWEAFDAACEPPRGAGHPSGASFAHEATDARDPASRIPRRSTFESVTRRLRVWPETPRARVFALGAIALVAVVAIVWASVGSRSPEDASPQAPAMSPTLSWPMVAPTPKSPESIRAADTPMPQPVPGATRTPEPSTNEARASLALAEREVAAGQLGPALQRLLMRTDAAGTCLRARARAGLGDALRALTDAERCLDLNPARKTDAPLARAVVQGLGTAHHKRAAKLLARELAAVAPKPLLDAATDPSGKVRHRAYNLAKKIGLTGFDRVALWLLDLRDARKCPARATLIGKLADSGDARALPAVEAELSRPPAETKCFKAKLFDRVRKLRQSTNALRPAPPASPSRP